MTIAPESALRGRLSLALPAIVVGANATASYPLAGKSSIAQPDCVAARYASRRLSICSHAQISTRTVRADSFGAAARVYDAHPVQSALTTGELRLPM